jgi:hypothetical protein
MDRDAWSARRWRDAFELWSTCINRTIWASVVSAPTLVARNATVPERLTEPPTTGLPGPFSTGSDSPVSRASSMLVVPVKTSPSTRIFSPGRGGTMSPATISAVGTVSISGVGDPCSGS